MNIPDEYTTTNAKMNEKIAKALAKQYIWASTTKIKKETQNKYHVASKEDRIKDGIIFASKAEMEEDSNLMLEVKAGKYWNLIRQPKFLLQKAFIDGEGKKHQAIWYFADWLFMDETNIYVRDKKGMKTKEYRMKKKLFLAKYPHFIFQEI